MKAVVLCGGKGTRLRPYTYNIPKPMLKLGNRPLLEFVLLNLKKNGIKDFILTVGYLRDQIEQYFGDGSSLGKYRLLERGRKVEYCWLRFAGKGSDR